MAEETTKGVIIAVCLGTLLMCACSPFYDRYGIQDDNAVEEVTESIVKGYTGMDIDLTPRSPE